METPPQRSFRSLTGLLVFFMLARTLVNVVNRMVYPFLPVLSRAFGVSRDLFAGAMSIRSVAGLVNIVLSGQTDRRGRKFGMLLGNGLFLTGVTLIVLWPTFPAFVAGMGLSSLGKYVLDSAILAFIGDEVPAHRRGRAFGLVELSWALSYLAGIWAVRILMERSGWLAPFPVIGVLALGMWVGIAAWVPAGGGSDRAAAGPAVSGAASILRNPAAVLVLLVSVSISAASELVAVVFAAWLEDSFGFTLAALAGAAVLIGIAELSGESLVGLLMDRLGAVRSVGLGLVLNSFFALSLPFIGRSPAGALIGLFCYFLTFEFTIVSEISVITEVPTASRATLIALNIASLSVGRIVAAWVALPLYGLGLFVVLGIAVLVNLGGLAALRRLALRLAASA